MKIRKKSENDVVVPGLYGSPLGLTKLKSFNPNSIQLSQWAQINENDLVSFRFCSERVAMFLLNFWRENSNTFEFCQVRFWSTVWWFHSLSQNIHACKDIKKDENVILRIAWQTWPTGQKKRDDATRMSWLSPPDIEVLLLYLSRRLGVSLLLS